MMRSMANHLVQARRDARSRAVFSSAALALCAAVILPACGGSGTDEAQAATTTTLATTTTTTEVPATLARPTTTAVAATIAPTTEATTTSTTTTTLAQQRTQPIAPPSDPDAEEPVIELGTLSIPKIDVEMTMYEGIRLSTLDYGPGHWPGSAMPGEPGNVVVGGHRTSKHKVFRRLDELVPGDELVFTDAAGVHTYLVDRVEIVDPSAMWIVNPTDTPQATLFACHPPGSTKQRIVVFADLAD